MGEFDTRQFAERLRTARPEHYKDALINAADFIEQQEDHHQEHHSRETEAIETLKWYLQNGWTDCGAKATVTVGHLCGVPPSDLAGRGASRLGGRGDPATRPDRPPTQETAPERMCIRRVDERGDPINDPNCPRHGRAK